MPGVIATIPRVQFSNAIGLPMAGGTLTVYLAGSTTPTNTWQNLALTTANTNPIALDSRGECVLWLDSSVVYKFVLKNALGVTQWTEDNISGAVSNLTGVFTKSADLAASGGAATVGFLQAGAGAVVSNLSQVVSEWYSVFRFMTAAQIADVKAKTFLLDVSGAISNAINAANGIKVHFPAGGYLLSDSLSLTVWKYSISGERNERSCNAPDYAGKASTILRFRPIDTTKSIATRSDPTVSFTDSIGPFEHENILFDVADCNGFKFGSEAIVPVTDGAGEKYIFGVRFCGVAFHSTQANRVSSATGVITRSGKTLVSLTKCFESTFQDVSLFGCDTQIKTTGCDKPVLKNIRSQASHLPIDFNGSGTFTVQHTVESLQVEGWTFSPVKSYNVDLSVNNSRFEQNDGSPVGGGLVNMSSAYGYTATVTAGTATLVFSASMNNILFPLLSVIRLVSGVNDEYCYVTAVSGANVTIDTTCFAFNWSAAAVTVYRIHGYGPLHRSLFDATISNISCGASLNCPAFVYVGAQGSMNIANAASQSGNYGNIQSLPIGNVYQDAFYLDQQMAFTNCTPLISAEQGHPYVTLSDTNKLLSNVSNVRTPIGNLSDAISTVDRVWAFTPKRYTTSFNNVHKIPFKRYGGDTFTDQTFYAWQVGGGVNLIILEQTLPSASNGFIRIRVRCKSVNATDILYLVASGAGGTSITNFTINNVSFNVYEYVGPIPAQWAAGRAANAGIILSAAGGVAVQSVIVEDLTPSSLQNYSDGGSFFLQKSGKKINVSTAVSTNFATIDLTPLSSRGGSIKIKIKSTQIVPNNGYCACYTEYMAQFSIFGGSIGLLGAPVLLSSTPASINSGVVAMSLVVTGAVASNILTLAATVSTTGSQPVTSSEFTWKMELINEQFLLINSV